MLLRYKTQTRPGLVTLYDIRPGNGVGLFLQHRSLHGAHSIGIIKLELRKKNETCWQLTWWI